MAVENNLKLPRTNGPRGRQISRSDHPATPSRYYRANKSPVISDFVPDVYTQHCVPQHYCSRVKKKESLRFRSRLWPSAKISQRYRIGFMFRIFHIESRHILKTIFFLFRGKKICLQWTFSETRIRYRNYNRIIILTQ